MSKLILHFLEVYKALDELCKQILDSERGISCYIEEMEKCGAKVEFSSDYKNLKRLRHIRNRLVHDADSFDIPLCEEKDIMYLEDFRSKIISLRDPLAANRQRTLKKSTEKRNIRQTVQPEYKEKNHSSAAGFFILLAAIFVIMILALIKK